MRPKEKAKELLWKYMPLINGWEDQAKTDLAKKLALVCVDEILGTKPLEKDYEDHGHRGRETWYNDKTDYWLSVKHELNCC